MIAARHRLRRLTSSDLRSAVLLFALLATCYLASVGLRASRGASITGDEPFYLVTTQSLIEDGNLDLRAQYATQSYRSFFDHPEPLWRQADPLEDGRMLSPHQPGLSVLLVPGFALRGLVGSQVQMLLIAALTYALAYLLIARETGRRGLAWAVTAVVALSPPAFVYATEIYPETPAAFCIVVSLWLLRAESIRWRTLALVAVLSALAWLGMKYVPVAGVIAAFYAWRATRRERAILTGLGALSAAAYLAWHLLTFGALTPYETNVVYDGASASTVLGAHVAFEDRVYRLWGLFVDRRFGIGRWAPVFLAVWPALPLAWSATRNGRVVTTVILVQITVATFVSITMMGWWFPGRMLVAVMPLFAFALTVLVARLPRRARAVAAVPALYSLLVTALLVEAARRGEVVLAVDPFEMSAWPFAILGRAFPQYTWWSEATIALNAAWLLAGLVATGMTIWIAHREALRRALARASRTPARSVASHGGRT